MGAPYPEALRTRALAAFDSGMSKWQVHKTFKIARSSLDDWLKLREVRGSIAAKTTYHRGRRPALEDCAEVHDFIEQHREKTQQQMAELWFRHGGQRLTAKTFCKTLKRLGYSRKKRVLGTGNAIWVREIALPNH